MQLVSSVRDYAVFLLDQGGHILTWNAGAERIKGYRAEEIIGQHFSRFYPQNSIASGWPEHELKVASETGRFEDEGWRLRKDGSKFWASVVITALRTDSGEARGFLKITRDMTDRKQAEEKLRLSEERFRLMVEGVKDYAIFMLDANGRVASWNSGAERIKGYRAEEIIGQHFSRFYPAEKIEAGWPQEELNRAIEDGQFEDEGWRLRKDGSTFWASVVITALKDESDRLVGFSKVTQDLTQRREAEQQARKFLQEVAARNAAEESALQLEQQREQLQITLASIGDAVIVTDDVGRITFLNPVAAELLGWSEEEAVGKPLEEILYLVNEETREPVENPVDKVFREKRVIELANHTSLVTRFGQEIPIEDTAAPIRGRGDTIFGAVLVFRDVTEARRTREARQYLAAIVESSDDAIIGQTLDGRIASWNRGAERLYGYKSEEVVGQPLAMLVPPDHPDEVPMILSRISQGDYIEHFETERVRKDGSRVDVSLTISPVRDTEGRVIGASKIARDITARKEEDRRKNEFLALLAHELRNPLAPLRNGLQVMRLAGYNKETIQEVHTLMERQLHHLVRLVDDLLDMSRITRGKIRLSRERITVAQAVQHGLEVMGSTLQEQGHQLTVAIPEEPILIEGDKTRLAQVLNNLLSNALKYSDPGSRIWLTVRREGEEAVISVKDSGIGIPQEMLGKVFDMFIQVDQSLEKSQGGLGVGLAISKRLIEMHGGRIEACSEGPGKGSEFLIHLPTIPVQPEVQSAAAKPSLPPPNSALRLLVVDDNRDAASSLSVMLRLMGHEVEMAYDGQSGLDLVNTFHPQVILLDIGMPRLNGYEVAKFIRQQPWGKRLTLVAITGWGQDEDRRKSEEAGFDFHLVKPVEFTALANLLANISRK